MRADLIRRRVWMGQQAVWVVKDPLSRAFAYLSDQEYEILGLADGTRSLAEIVSECSKRFAPQYISSESLVRFFAEARVKGLVLVDGSGVSRVDAEDAGRRRWWQNPLAIRLPGLNPSRLLERISPVFRPLYSPFAVVLAMLLVSAAAVIVVGEFSVFADHLAAAASRMGAGGSIGLLLVVVSLTKIIHELAHALTCKHFGGECREIGVMFLVGIPCLYCDVSDAWLLDRRWKRIFVSAAGMAAEVTLAALATMIWVFTIDGAVRDVCVTIMIVCSVTTVLFNGNPLLRYDGYYILSDLVGIPNLASESAATVRGWLRRWIWATPVAPSSPAASHRGLFVVVYGVASGLYRVAVYMFILLMLYRVAERYELGGMVGTLGLVAVAWFLFKWAKSILAPPDRSVRRASMSPRRPAIIVTGLATAGLLIGLIPLPRSVVAPMSVQPAGSQTLFVTSEGALVESVDNGTDVSEGQLVAKLRNPEVDRELIAIESECDRLAAQLESLRQRRSSNRELSARIPWMERSLEEAIKQKQLRRKVADHLLLASPRSGRIFAPPELVPPPMDDRQPRFWSGTPLEPMNHGAWLTEGTRLCIVGDSTAREAVVMMRQQDVELVGINQPVTLLLADRRRGAVTGRVLEVAASPSEPIPAELKRGERIDPAAVSARTPYYQVRVALDPTPIALPVRLTGHARIKVHHASILARIARFLSDSFG